MNNFSHSAYNVISKFGYLGIFIVFMIEGTGLPLPVQLLFIAAAYFIDSGKMMLTSVVIIAATGNLLGNIIAYYLGFYGRKPIIDKLSRFLHIRFDDIKKIEKWFCKYGSLTNMVSRWIGITRTPAIWASGLFSINIYHYMLFSFIGNLIWAFVSILLYLEIFSSLESLLVLPLKYKILIVIGLVLGVVMIWRIFFVYLNKQKS